MDNEMVVEITEEITEATSGRGLKTAAGIGLAMLAGAIAYKHVVTPMMAKLKARKEASKVIEDDVDHGDYDETETTEE